MDDLIEFLRARLDEDEAVARATAWNASTQIYNAWEAVPPEDEDGDWRIRQKGEVFILLSCDGEEMAKHVARQDPARVLREVEAKRSAITETLRHAAVVDGEWGCCHDAEAIGRGECEDNPPNELTGLQILAAVYSDRPDYRPEWAPSA